MREEPRDTERSAGGEDAAAPEPPPASSTLARDLARQARRALDTARPEVGRLVQQARPRIEKAARDALHYAREHEDELKQAATRIAQARVPRILRPAVDAVIGQVRPAAGPSTQLSGLKCGHCGALSAAAAKFCSECGQSLLQQRP